jgi:hypothetical protein
VKLRSWNAGATILYESTCIKRENSNKINKTNPEDNM